MKLIRFGAFNQEKPGIHSEGLNYDVSNYIKDYDEAFFRDGGLYFLASIVEKHLDTLAVIDKEIRIGSPVSRPSKIVCIGMNYADHAKEINIPAPSEPVIFMKATTAFIGPFDNIQNSCPSDDNTVYFKFSCRKIKLHYYL